MMSCEFCRGAIPDDAKKCQHCGEWVGKRDPEKPSHLFTVVSLVVITFVAMMLLLGVYP